MLEARLALDMALGAVPLRGSTVRLRAHVIIAGQFIKAGTPIPDGDVPKAFLKYREGGPPIPGLAELPLLQEQDGRSGNSNGGWVAVEGADTETLRGPELKNKRAYLRLKARREVDPALREEHLASLRQCYQRRKAKAGKQGAQPAQTIVESGQDSPAPSLPIEMTFNGEAPIFGARYFQRGGRYVCADSERPRSRELIFKWDGMDFVCCGMVPDSVRDIRVIHTSFIEEKPEPMSHSEFSRKGGASKSPAKIKAVRGNLKKAQRARAAKRKDA
jgi:hypothetical protein